jgi:hypothetical protein
MPRIVTSYLTVGRNSQGEWDYAVSGLAAHLSPKEAAEFRDMAQMGLFEAHTMFLRDLQMRPEYRAGQARSEYDNEGNLTVGPDGRLSPGGDE